MPKANVDVVKDRKNNEQEKSRGSDMSMKVIATGTDEHAILGRSRNETLIDATNQKEIDKREPGPGISDDIKRVGSVLRMQDIIDAISVVISSGEGIKPDKLADFIDVLDMRVATPRLVEKMDAQVQFVLDPLREWCLLTITQINAQFPETLPGIHDFIQHLYRGVESITDSFYRRFAIREKKYLGDMRIVLPECVGFPTTINDLNVPGLDSYVMDNRQNFRPRASPRCDYETIKIVLPQIFHNLHMRTQEF